MADTITDLAERERALDPERSFIVQAPAGSGKTSLLTQRYLNLLARVEAPEEIVAITFTRKAAAEMRGRILEALHAAAGPAPAADSHERTTLTLAQRALERDRRLGWELAAFPGRLRVQTIDSLCAGLTRQMPMLSGFGSQPAITETAQALYREAARRTIELLETGDADWTPAVGTLLDHLDNQPARLEGLLVTMLGRRDQWLRHLAGTGPAHHRAAVGRAIEHLHHDALAALDAALPGTGRGELAELAAYAMANVEPDANQAALAEWLAEHPGTLPPRESLHLPAWRALADLLLKKDGDWRRAVDKRVGFPAGSAGAKEMKARMLALLESLRELPGLGLALAEVQQVPGPPREDTEWPVLEALIHLLPVAAAQLRLVFGERGEVDFIEVAQRAVQALGTPEQPTDLALGLDYRIRHLLVDEFQDTSMSQFELLERLTAGWTPGDGRTLFAVGDPMQSIYRFREAQVGLYLRARNDGLGSVPLEPLTLRSNFRSRAGIVEWVNATFPGVLPGREDIGTGAVPYSPASPVLPAEGTDPVVVHPVIGDDRETEAAAVTEVVRQARREGDVAVLVRSRSHAGEVMAHLAAAGFRPMAVELERLGQRPVVQDLLVLTRAVVHPADRTAWLAILRAPWCGLTVADLAALVEEPAPAPGRPAAIWDALQDDSALQRLDGEARHRVERLVECLQPVLAGRRRLPLRRAVERAWLELGGPACHPDASDLDDAAVFLDLLDRLDAGGDLLELAALEEQLESLFAVPTAEADREIQVMTMHKAKGLEFDTVVLPGLGRPPRAPEQPLLAWSERPRPAGDADLLLAPIPATGTEPGPVFQYLRRLEKVRDDHEVARLLYVAATRARRRLHLVGHARPNKDNELRPAANSLLKRLWPAVEEDFIQAYARTGTAGAETAEADGPVQKTLRRHAPGWRPPEPPPALALPAEPDRGPEPVPYDWAGATIRHVGTVVHRLLQQVATDGVEQWPRARLDGLHGVITALLEREGVPGEELEAARTTVFEALHRTLADETGRWLLAGHAEAASELPVSGVVDGRVVNAIIDRSFVDPDGSRWVVDYKTSEHAGGDLAGFLDLQQARYREQLETYGALLRAAGETRPVRLGLYFPLLGAFRSW